jgi:hypothetical protein
MTDSENLDIETTGTAATATEERTMTQTVEAATTTATTTAGELVDIETLGKDLPGWKLAGLMRHQRWAPGKAVPPAIFEAALAAFAGRPLGGGR